MQNELVSVVMRGLHLTNLYSFHLSHKETIWCYNSLPIMHLFSWYIRLYEFSVLCYHIAVPIPVSEVFISTLLQPVVILHPSAFL